MLWKCVLRIWRNYVGLRMSDLQSARGCSKETRRPFTRFPREARPSFIFTYNVKQSIGVIGPFIPYHFGTILYMYDSSAGFHMYNLTVTFNFPGLSYMSDRAKPPFK